MNLDTALEHRDGGWHYVTYNRRVGTHPIGFCRDHAPHATEDEARECFNAYRRANVRLVGTLGSWSDCSVPGCGAPTKKFASIRHDGFHTAPLCPDHLTIEHAVPALGLDGLAGDAWHS
jgi:hypothetical protein